MNRLLKAWTFSLLLTAVMAAQSLAANIYWIGSADDVKQVDTITASGGPWTAGKHLTVTCNNKTVTVELNTSLTASDAVAAMSAAINAFDATTGLVNDETRNRGGQELGEFRDFVSSASGAVLTLTSTTAGTPYIVTASDDDASGVFTTVVSVTAATGKSWIDNAKNYAGGVVPSTGDIVVFSDGSIPVLHGFPALSQVNGMTRLGSYLADIGLHRTNITHSGFSYPEYRQRACEIKANVGSAVINIGDGTGNSTGITVIETTAAAFRINDTALPSSDGLNPIELSSTTGDVTLYVQAGNVDAGTRGKGGDITFSDVAMSGGSVRFEGLVAASSSLHVTGGTFESSVALTNFSTLLKVSGGTATFMGSGAIASFDADGGTVDFRAGQVVDVEVRNGGTVTFDNDAETKSVTSIKLHSGATLNDRNGVAIPTGEYHFMDCEPADVTLRLPKNFKYSPTAL